MTSVSNFHIRPARASDRDAIFAMVSTIWDGEDYVPEVWDAWLADTGGPLLVGELDGRPVALAKLSSLGPGEDWFHGARVDPACQGRGFSRAMLQRCVDLSRERRARTLRFLTDVENIPMQRAGAGAGFRLAYAPIWYVAPMRVGPSAAAPLPPERLVSLLVDRRGSALLERSAGMYSYDWHVFDLSEARLREHLARGEIVGLPGESAWAIVIPRHDGGGAWLAHLEGDADEIARLYAALLTSPGAPAGGTLRALLPPDAPCVAAMRATGLAEPEYHMRVYELRLRR